MGRNNLRGDDRRRSGSKGGRSDRSSSSGSYGDRSYGNRSYGDRPSYGGGDRGGFSRPPREMHKAICAECGKECEVPFKPTEGRPVYCRDCFAKQRTPRY